MNNSATSLGFDTVTDAINDLLEVKLASSRHCEAMFLCDRDEKMVILGAKRWLRVILQNTFMTSQRQNALLKALKMSAADASCFVFDSQAEKPTTLIILTPEFWGINFHPGNHRGTGFLVNKHQA